MRIQGYVPNYDINLMDLGKKQRYYVYNLDINVESSKHGYYF